MAPLFDHEKLVVYQDSLKFVQWAEVLLAKLPKNLSVTDQLDRASTSIPLNIAEGNGKFTPRDRCRFFDQARGSALESAGCLDVLAAKGKATPEEALAGKESLRRIVSMPVGLIKSNSPDRMHEEPAEYSAVGDEQREGD